MLIVLVTYIELNLYSLWCRERNVPVSLDCRFLVAPSFFSIVYNVAAYPLVFEGWHFSNRGELWQYKLNPTTLYSIFCTKSGKWAVHSCLYLRFSLPFIYNVAAYPLVFEGWHFNNRGGLCSSKLNPATFYWMVCTKPGKWAVMNLCVQFFDYILELVFFVFHFIISMLIQYSEKIKYFISKCSIEYMSPQSEVIPADVIVHRYNCPISINGWHETQIDHLILMSVINVISFPPSVSIYKGVCHII